MRNKKSNPEPEYADPDEFAYDKPDVGPDKIDVRHAVITDLTPDARNANQGTARGGGMLEDSLGKYGAGRSVLADRNGQIIAGNKTWEKWGEAGNEGVIVVRTDGTQLVVVQRTDLDLDADVAARELALADNAVGAASLEWDPAVLLELSEEGLDVAQFFQKGEWDDLMARLEASADDAGSGDGDGGDADAVPTPEEYRVKRGDLWQLGPHRLYCGDAGNEADMAVLMMSINDIVECVSGQTVGDGKSHKNQSHKAALVFTDPPYNHGSGNRLEAANVRETMNDLKEADWDRDADLAPALAQILLHLASDATVYACASQHTAGTIWDWMKEWSSHFSYCVWHKDNPMPSLTKRHWTWDMELICYATRGRHTFHFPEEGHALATWDIPRASEQTGHPTEKPVALALRAITHSSNVGDIVLDPYAGAGTTLMACHLSRRVAFCMEIAPRWCDVILTRFEKATGLTAERLVEGAGEADETVGETAGEERP